MSDRDTAVLRRTMAAIVGSAPEAPELPSPGSDAMHRSRRPVPALVAASAVLIALVAVGGALIVRQSQTDVATTPSTTMPASEVITQPATTWEHVIDQPALEGTVWAIASNNDAVVAVGDDFDIVADEGSADSPNVVVWASTDGQSWDRIDDESLFGGEGIQQAFQIAAGPLGFVASGEDVPNTVLWFSPDGYGWTRVLDNDLGTAGMVEGLTVVAGGPGWIAYDGGDGAATKVVAVSSDGLTWEMAPDSAYDDELQRLLQIEAAREPATLPMDEDRGIGRDDWLYAWDGRRVVAVATWWDMLYESPDAGATWIRVDPDQSAFDIWPRPLLLATAQFNDLTIVGGNGIWIGSATD